MVAIVGVGETEFKRGHTRGIDSLCVEAGRRAIADSGLAPAGNRWLHHAASSNRRSTRSRFGVGRQAASLQRHQCLRAGAGSDRGAGRSPVCHRGGARRGRARYVRHPDLAAEVPAPHHARDPLKADLKCPWVSMASRCTSLPSRSVTSTNFVSSPSTSDRLRWRSAMGESHAGSAETAAHHHGRLSRVTDHRRALHDLDCCLITDGAGAYIVTSREARAEAENSSGPGRGCRGRLQPLDVDRNVHAEPRLPEHRPGRGRSRAFRHAGISTQSGFHRSL